MGPDLVRVTDALPTASREWIRMNDMRKSYPATIAEALTPYAKPMLLGDGLRVNGEGDTWVGLSFDMFVPKALVDRVCRLVGLFGDGDKGAQRAGWFTEAMLTMPDQFAAWDAALEAVQALAGNADERWEATVTWLNAQGDG